MLLDESDAADLEMAGGRLLPFVGGAGHVPRLGSAAASHVSPRSNPVSAELAIAHAKQGMAKTLKPDFEKTRLP